MKHTDQIRTYLISLTVQIVGARFLLQLRNIRKTLDQSLIFSARNVDVRYFVEIREKNRYAC